MSVVNASKTINKMLRFIIINEYFPIAYLSSMAWFYFNVRSFEDTFGIFICAIIYGVSYFVSNLIVLPLKSLLTCSDSSEYLHP